MGVESAILGAAAASTASSATGSIFNALNQQSIAKHNAAVAKIAAKDAIRRGRESERRYKESVRGLIGTQRVSYAGQGVDVNFGSARDVQADTARIGELNALTIRNNAIMEAFGYREQAASFRMQGDAVFGEGIQGAAGTILGGAANLATMKYYMTSAPSAPSMTPPGVSVYA